VKSRTIRFSILWGWILLSNAHENLSLLDLFDLQELQKLQDEFSDAAGVASIIMRPDGTRITAPSNFRCLCQDIIRKTPKGLVNCCLSDASLGVFQFDGSNIGPCLSGGLLDAGAAISVDGRHIANWVIGQVRDETQTEEGIRAYAREIGADEIAAVKAFYEVPSMSRHQFEKITRALFSLARQLSNTAYKNIQLAQLLADRDRATAELKASEAKYRGIVDSAFEGIWLLDQDAKTTFVNDSMAKMLGYAPEEMIGQPVTYFLLDEDIAMYQQEIQIRREGVARQFERRFRCKDGRVLWTLATGSSIFDDDNRLVNMFAMFTDITERKQTEIELAKRNRALRMHTDVSQVLVRITDETTLLNEVCRIIVQEGGYRMAWVGYIGPADDTIVLPISFFGIENGYLANLHIDLNDDRRGSGPVGSAIRTGKPQVIQNILTDPVMEPWRQDALRLGYNSSITIPLSDAQRTFGMLGIYSAEPGAFSSEEIEFLEELRGDLEYGILALHSVHKLEQAQRALKESEFRFRTITEEAPVGVCIHQDGQFKYVNPVYVQMLGWTPEELLTIKPWSVIHPDDLERATSYLQYDIESKHGRRHYEARFLTRCGDAIDVDVLATAVEYMGQPATLGIVIDITERKRVDSDLHRYREDLDKLVRQRTSELIDARDQAQAANRAKSAFLANMSHELRTPLSAVLGFSSLMRSAPGATDAQCKTLDIINRSGEHLLGLVNDVLDVARIESGSIANDPTSCDLVQMMQDINDLMRLRIEEKGLQLAIDQSARFPRFVQVDEAKLRQVLLNLIGNAVKYTEHGTLTLRLDIAADSKSATDMLMFDVRDTGPGIAPEDCARIFDPFCQLGDSQDRKGAGLGLTISKQFIEVMGGSITFDSVVGIGTCFHVTIPVERVGEPEISPTIDPMGRVTSLASGQPRYRVLIAEDQPDNSLLLRKILEAPGFEVRVCENGALAVQEFENWHPHFIWMDLLMPVMDGLEATRAIRGLPGGDTVKIVGLSALAYDKNRQECLSAGMDDFRRKPFRPRKIYRCMVKHLGVQFNYEDAVSSQPGGLLEVTTMPVLSLAIVPDELKGRLMSAIVQLDTANIDAAIRDIADLEPATGKSLAGLAERLSYSTIYEALEQSIAAGGVRFPTAEPRAPARA